MGSRWDRGASNRGLRQRDRFDYKVYNSTGEKVPLTSKRVGNQRLTTMAADPNVAKVSGELNGFLFEINEAIEEQKDVSTFAVRELRGFHDEMRSCRSAIARVSAELLVLMGDASPDDLKEKTKVALAESKTHLSSLKAEISRQETLVDDALDADRVLAAKLRSEELLERKFAFDATTAELTVLRKSLTEA